MSDLYLAARDLTAGYYGIPVVRDLNLEVRAGEIVVLLGPNGAGKSTTLLALAGELPLITGSVELFGTEAHGPLQRRAKQGLAFVPEERGLFGQLTVTENFRLGQGSVESAFAHGPELKAMRRRRAGMLSGGEQRILVLARALAANPRLVMADELSLGLAPLVVNRILTTLRRAADDGAAVLLVEQHARQVLNVADRGYVIRRGGLELQGTATDLLEHIAEIEGVYLAAKNGSSPAHR